MLWVGGSILVHGLAELGYHTPEHIIESATSSVTAAFAVAPAIVGWITTSALQAVFAVAIGAAAIVVMGNVVAPILAKIRS